METNNFVFKIKVILGLESAPLSCLVAKIGLNGPMPNRVKVWRNILGVTIEANNFVLRSKPY